MKQRLKPMVVGLVVSGLIAAPAFADANKDLVLALQKQVSDMQSQIDSLKENHPEQKNHKKKHSKTSSSAKKHHAAHSKTSQDKQIPVTVTAAEEAAEKVDEANANKTDIIGPNNLPSEGLTYLPIDLDVPGQSFVSTGPYLGVQLSYSGSNLIINTPSVNEDVSLLKLRKNMETRLSALGIEHPEDHSHLLLSGNIEGQAVYKNRGHASDTSDIDVTNAELDAYILGPSSWTSGLMTLNYENDIGSSSGAISSNHRTFNSRVFINKAFITVGDFSKTNFYGTIGQMFVPFGTYGSSMIASPMTKSLFRTKARAILIGYQQQTPNAFYASGYVFRGDAHSGTTSRINNGGFNIGIKYKLGEFSGDIGYGVIQNIADADGMQVTESKPFFDGFGSSSTACGPTGTSACGSEKLVHGVPANDFRGTLNFGKWDLLAEYITSATAFNPNDLSYNGNGARPQALNAEAAYTFTLFDKPTSIAAGYGMTKDALAIGLPEKRWALVLNTSWWRNTLESLEFRHDMNYRGSATASGSGVASAPGTGASDNVVTAQFDIFF